MGKMFIPYVYVPSAESDYIEVVSPWGSVKLPVSLNQFYGVLVAISVVITTILITCCGSSKKKKTMKKAETSKKKGLQSTMKAENSKNPQVVSSKEAKSALEENIQRNGANSYYYAHKVREISPESTPRLRQVISTYGWSDATKSVTIYVNHPDAATLNSDKIQLEWTPTSLSLDITFQEDDVRSLVIPSLYAEVSDVSYKCKRDSIAFTLKKKEIVAWKSLNGAMKHIEQHIEYDDSLYE